MDITTLIRQAIEYAIPAIPAIGEGVTSGVGSDIWNFFKKTFSFKQKENELEILQKDAQNIRQQTKVELILEEALKNDETLLIELKALVEMAKAQKPNIDNSIKVSGDHNNIIQNVKGSTINFGNVTNTHHNGTGDIVSGNQITNNNYYGNTPINPEKGAIWKKMLTENKVSDAIEYLLIEYENDNDKTKTLLLLFSQYNRNQANINNGIITDKDAEMVQNKIVYSLLNVFG